jgi:hypothetical protein
MSTHVYYPNAAGDGAQPLYITDRWRWRIIIGALQGLTGSEWRQRKAHQKLKRSHANVELLKPLAKADAVQ